MEEDVLEKELAVKKPQNKRNKVIVLILVIGIICYAIYSILHGDKPKSSVKPPVDLSVQDQQKIQALNERLQEARNQLKDMQSKMNDVPPIQQVSKTPMNDELSKERALRMNADTEIGISGGSSGGLIKVNASAGTTSGLVSTDPNSAFANSQSTKIDTVSATQIDNPDYKVVQGEFLHAVLTVAISSELPGMVEASLTQPVYSFTGKHLLLPAGSRLIGQFTSAGSNPASTRLFVVWNRVITPKGVSVMLNSTSTDQLGRSGQSADYVATHFWTIFGTSALLSIIGVGNVATSNSTSEYPNVADQYRLAITQSLGNTANKLLGNRLGINPTLHIHQGTEINVFVAHDLDFSSLKHGS
jgi:type IV secretion system protein VirB10